MILDLIELITRMCPEQSEAQSMEELMREIQDTNSKIKNKSGKEIVVAFMDISALYPSLDQAESARIVKEEFVSSGWETEGVD